MDLRQMRYFVAVAEELHFGRAARRLNIAQPPLSQTIRRLETDLGVDLFDRTRRSVDLTPAGRVFLQEARRTLMQAELAGKMARRAGSKVSEVRVSFIGQALFRILPELLVRYRVAAPNVHVRLLENSSAEQLAGILAGDFDIGIVSSVGVTLTSECDSLIVERAPFVAAVPADWPVAKAKAISPADLARLPFISPPRQYAAMSTNLASMFQDIGLMPQVTQEATQVSTVLSLVGAGLGCSIVMATALLTRAHNVSFLPLIDHKPLAQWQVMMVWHRDQIGDLGKDFIQFTSAHVRDNPHLIDGSYPVI